MTAIDADRLAPPPSLLGSVRASLTDYLENAWRLVVPNLVWGALLALTLAATSVSPFAWLLAPLLAVPAIGIFRVAALIVRREPVSTLDAFTAWARFGVRALVAGTLTLGLGAVFVVNIVTGLQGAGLLGWVFATFAGWGLIAVLVVTTVVWPLLVDPRRDALGLRGGLRLASLLALAFPLRFGALTLVLAAFVAASTFAVVMLLTIAIGLSALVACHYVLPAADRLGRAPRRCRRRRPDADRSRGATRRRVSPGASPRRAAAPSRRSAAGRREPPTRTATFAAWPAANPRGSATMPCSAESALTATTVTTSPTTDAVTGRIVLRVE